MTVAPATQSTVSVASSSTPELPLTVLVDEQQPRMEVTPTLVEPGQQVTVSFAGELSEEWVTGVELSVETETLGQWRTTWILISDEFPGSPVSITPTAEWTVPAIGIVLSAEQAFGLPSQLASGHYRACMTVHGPEAPSEPLCAEFRTE